MGCTLGYGALHRLPAPLIEPSTAPGEVMFDGENARFSNEESRAYTLQSQQQQQDGGQFFVPAANANAQVDESNFLVPANVVSPPVTGGGGGGGGKKKKVQRGGGGLDDYFNEGEKKSRELDHAPSAKSTPPPPPPKGGPPPSALPAPEAEKAEGEE